MIASDLGMVWPQNSDKIIKIILLRGKGGPQGSNHEKWVRVPSLGDRKGHGGHLAEKFLKEYYFWPELSRVPYRDLAVVTRLQLASNKWVYLKRSF